jgi:CheY-like chemotaxis protein
MSAGDSDLKFIKEAANQLNGLLTELSGFMSVMEQLLRSSSEGKELLPMMVGTLDRASTLTQKLQTFIYEKEGNLEAARALSPDLYGSTSATPLANPGRPGPARIPLGPMRQVQPVATPVPAVPVAQAPALEEPAPAAPAAEPEPAAQAPALSSAVEAPPAAVTEPPPAAPSAPAESAPALTSAVVPGEAPTKVTRSVDPGLMGNNELIMVVDDEKNILMLVEMMLKSANYRLLKAGSGEEALVLFDEHADEISLTILDFTMEGMNGRDVFLRIIEKQPEARVLMSSGYAEASALKEMLAKGLRGYIPKPYSRDRLLFQVKSVMSN